MSALSSSNTKIWKGSATLFVKKEKIEAFKKAVAKIILPTRMEQGCISYHGYQIFDENGQETNKFKFHEIWKTREAMLIDHKENSLHMKEFFKEIHADTPESFLESFEVAGDYAIEM